MKGKKFGYGFSVFVIVFVLLIWGIPCTAGDPGVFPNKIVIGSPADLEGPAGFATKASIEGAKAYFTKAYREKTYPRKIQIIQEHGGYSPAICMKAAKLLLERDKVFCFFLTSGASATLALNTLLEEEKIPLIGMHCQAEAAAIPPKRYIFQMFTTYMDQAKIAVDYIVERDGKDAKVAFFYQDDQFGYDGLKGFRTQMKKYGIKAATKVSYKRGAIDLSSHALRLKSADPDWVILHCLWGAGSKILKEAQKIGWRPQFLGISGTADPVILRLAGDAVKYGKPFMGVTINYPFDGDSFGAKEYRDALKKYQPEALPGTFSIWGYGFAKILIEGLSRIQGEPTREKLIMALEIFKGYETGVFPPLTWAPGLRKGSRGGMIVVQEGNTFVPITGWRHVKKIRDDS
jgi:branched-chain amino acid transport system substrate-binding protein